MIALPVLGLAFAAVTYDMFDADPGREGRPADGRGRRPRRRGRYASRSGRTSTAERWRERRHRRARKPATDRRGALRTCRAGSRAIACSTAATGDMRTADRHRRHRDRSGVDAADPLAAGIVDGPRRSGSRGRRTRSRSPRPRPTGSAPSIGGTVTTADRKRTLYGRRPGRVPGRPRRSGSSRAAGVRGAATRVWLVDTPTARWTGPRSRASTSSASSSRPAP